MRDLVRSPRYSLGEAEEGGENGRAEKNGMISEATRKGEHCPPANGQESQQCIF